MFYLLDVNALIALADTRSKFRVFARSWLQGLGSPVIASSPITENGFLRIFGHPSYPHGPGSIQEAARALHIIKQRERYLFIPDDLSLLDKKLNFDLAECTPKQLTDLYLLGLAKQHGGKFATFDARISTKTIRGGAAALCIIPT